MDDEETNKQTKTTTNKHTNKWMNGQTKNEFIKKIYLSKYIEVNYFFRASTLPR